MAVVHLFIDQRQCDYRQNYRFISCCDLMHYCTTALSVQVSCYDGDAETPQTLSRLPGHCCEQLYYLILLLNVLTRTNTIL